LEVGDEAGVSEEMSEDRIDAERGDLLVTEAAADVTNDDDGSACEVMLGFADAFAAVEAGWPVIEEEEETELIDVSCRELPQREAN